MQIASPTPDTTMSGNKRDTGNADSQAYIANEMQMLNLEVSKYALSKILDVLNSQWQPGINYDNLKAVADRHTKRIRELEDIQQSAQADLSVCTCENPRSHYYDKGICPDCGLPF